MDNTSPTDDNATPLATRPRAVSETQLLESDATTQQEQHSPLLPQRERAQSATTADAPPAIEQLPNDGDDDDDDAGTNDSAAERQRLPPAVDARTVVLAKHTRETLQRADIDSWIFSSLYTCISLHQPMDKDADLYRPVSASTSLHDWRTVSIDQQDHQQQQHESQPVRYRLTQQTRVFTVASVYTLLLVVDASASVNSVDKFASGSHVVMESLFSVLHTLLRGLAVPLQTQEAKVTVLVSVLLNMGELAATALTLNAEAEGVKQQQQQQSASGGANVRMVAQEFDLTSGSFRQLFEMISQAVRSHEGRTTERRQRSGSIMGRRALARSSSRSRVLQDAAAAAAAAANQPTLSILDHALSVIGMGSVGAAPLMIYLTDGISSIGFRENRPSDNIRLLAARDIPVHVVLLTCSDGYSPNCSFGHVPDIDEMRFLAMATGGRFLYASDIPQRHFGMDTEQVNFVHRAFLLRERMYLKASKAEQRTSRLMSGLHDRRVDFPREIFTDSKMPLLMPTSAEGAFPWSFSSRPPPVSSILARYRDYDIPPCLNHFIKARSNEGFELQSIIGDFRDGKTDKVSINLALCWSPHVTIQYRIKATVSLQSDTECPMLVNAARVELNVLAYKEFAIFFVNYQVTTAAKRTPAEAALLASISEVHDYLKVLYDGDTVQKVMLDVSGKLLQQTIVNDAAASPTATTAPAASPRRGEVFQTLTQIIESLIKLKAKSCFKEYMCDIIMHSTIATGSGGQPTATTTTTLEQDPGSAGGISAAVLQRIGSQIKQLEGLLLGATSFKLLLTGGDTVFVKMLEQSPEHAEKLMMPQNISFVALRLMVDSSFLLRLQILCFNTHSQQEAAIVASIKQLLVNARPPSFMLCERPVTSVFINGVMTLRQARRGRRAVAVAPMVDAGFLSLHEWRFDSELFTDGQALMQMFPGESSSLDLAFAHILRSRRDDGFALVSQQSDEVVLYREHTVLVGSEQSAKHRKLGVMYKLTRDLHTVQLVCQVYVEPAYEQSAEAMLSLRQMRAHDEKIVSQIFSFDCVYTGWLRKSPPSKDRVSTAVRRFFDPSRTVLNAVTIAAGIPTCLELCAGASAAVSLPSTPVSPLVSPLSDNGITISPSDQDSQANMSSSVMSCSWGEATTGAVMSAFDEHCCPHLCEIPMHELPLIWRKQLLLSLYFRQAARTVLDFELPVAEAGPTLQQLVDATTLALQQFEDSLPSAGTGGGLFCMSNCHFRCFVQGRRNVSYIMLIGASLCGLLRNATLPAAAEAVGPCYTPLLIVDVQRTKPPLQTDDDDEIKVPTTLVAPFVLSSVQPPHRASASSWLSKSANHGPSFTPSDITPSILHLERAINGHWEAGFVRMTAAMVLQGEHVSQTELEHAFSYCTATEVNVDMTRFMLTLRHRLKQLQAGNSADVQARFIQVVERHFTRLVTADRSPTFVYTPASLKGFFAKPVADIMQAAWSPIFLRATCIVHSGQVNGPTEWTQPVHFAEALARLDVLLETVEDIGAWIEQPRRPLCLLKLLYMQPKLEEGASVPFPLPSAREGSPEPPQLTAAPYDIQQEFESSRLDMEAKLRGFFTEETLSNLMGITPITAGMIEYVRSLLSEGPSSASPRYKKFVIPLSFVKPPRDYFARLLDRIDFAPYTVSKVGAVYYLSLELSRVPDEGGDKSTESDTASIMSDKSAAAASAAAAGWANSLADDYIEGLGIVVERPSEEQDRQALSRCALTVGPNIWFLFVVEGNSVEVLYYGDVLDAEARETLFDAFRRAIAQAAHITNQLLLLADMRETHSCSKFLLTPDTLRHPRTVTSGSVNSAATPEVQTDSMRMGRKFQIGQFECPVVYVRAFDLHWRMKANAALNSIAAVLSAFSVTNRKNLYVVSASTDSIFYMRIREGMKTDRPSSLIRRESGGDTGSDLFFSAAPSGSETPFSLSASVVTPEAVTSALSSPQTAVDGSMSAPPPRETSSPLSTAPSSPRSRLPSTQSKLPVSDQRVLIMELHGVDKPTREFIEELVSMVESKLTTATLSVLSAFLVRSSTAKLTKADIDFLIPAVRGPRKRAFYPLLSDFSATYRLLLYLKQNLSVSLSPLSGPDVNTALHRYFQRHFDIDWPTASAQSSETFPVQPGDFAFIYHALSNRGHPALEASVGQGVACISITPVRKNVELVYELPRLAPRPPTSLASSELFTRLQASSFAVSPEGEHDMWLLVEIWSIGSVDIDALLRHVQGAMQQACVDYLVEAALPVHFDADGLSHDRLQAACRELTPPLNFAKQPNVAIHTYSIPIRLPPWSLAALQSTVKAHLDTLSEAFAISSSTDYVIGQPLVGTATTAPRFYLFAYPKALLVDKSAAAAAPNVDSSEGDKVAQQSLDCAMVEADRATIGSKALPDLSAVRAAIHSISPADVAFSGSLFPHIARINHVDVERNFFILAAVTLSSIDVLSYNWKRPVFDALVQQVQHFVDHQRAAVQMGSSIALQKMGMFEQQRQQWSSIAPIVDSLPSETAHAGESEADDTPLAVVYRDGFPTLHSEQTDSTTSTASASVQRFTAYREEQEAAISRQRQLLAIYTRWTRRHEAGEQAADLTTADVRHILRAVRLIHWVRTPLLFSQKRDDLFVLSGEHYVCSTPQRYPSSATVSAAQGDDKSQSSITAFFRQLVGGLMNSYVSYLKSLGMSVIISRSMEDMVAASPAVSDPPRFQISDGQTVDTDVIYLQKSFQGGVLLIEFTVSGMFACVNLHTVNRRYGRHKLRQPSPGFSTPDYSRQSFKLFTEECTRFKNLIHLNSFVYDYHLQTMQSLLENGAAARHLNLLDLLRAFARYNPSPARYARCQLHQGTISIRNQEITNDLLPYILRDPRRYGMSKVVLGDGASNACYLSSIAPSLEPDYSFTMSEKRRAEHRYVVVVAPPCRNVELADGTLTLEYFVLVVNMDNRWPHQTLAHKETSAESAVPFHLRVNTQPQPPSQPHSPLEQTLPGTQVSVAELLQNAEKKVQAMIDKAVQFFSRDALWKSLVTGAIHRATPNVSIDDLLTLSRRFSTFSLQQLDPSLSALLCLPRWTNILDKALINAPFESPRETKSGNTRLVTMYRVDDITASDMPELVYQVLVYPDQPTEIMVVVREDTETLTMACRRNVQLFVRWLCRAAWQSTLAQ